MWMICISLNICIWLILFQSYRKLTSDRRDKEILHTGNGSDSSGTDGSILLEFTYQKNDLLLGLFELLCHTDQN